MTTDAQTPRRQEAKGAHGMVLAWVRASVRLCVRALLPIAASGVASAVVAQGAPPSRVAELRWDARLSVRSVPRWAPGTATLAPFGRGTATTLATPRRTGALVTEVIFGAVGSAGGAVAGIHAGRGFCEATSPCDGEDPGLIEGFTGAIVGSVVGTALGTHLGARASGGRGGHFGARLGGALLGLLAGGAAASLVGGDVDQTLVLITFPVVQSLVTVLLAPRD